MSNDPADIRAFVAAAGTRGCIYKLFSGAGWRESDGTRVAGTMKVRIEDLEDEFSVQTSPGIYQVEVSKAFEVRVVVMGRQTFAVAIYSQEQEDTRLDWRDSMTGPPRTEVIELPLAVAHDVYDLMERLGLVFGCIDFIVGPDGQYTFLEVNQAGQFLFMEYWQPSIPIFDAFVDFLVSTNPAPFVYRPRGERLQYSVEFYNEMVKSRVEADAGRHSALVPKWKSA